MEREYTFTRYAMYKRLEEVGRALPKRDGSLLSISHSLHLGEVLGIVPASVTEANYPEVNILHLPYAPNTFDVVLSDQVFEHIEGDPQVAIDECLRVLKPGGVMVHTTCFLVPYHGPGDFWRYTPEGLRLLCRTAKVLEADGFGHPFMSVLTFLNFTRTSVVVAKWHPMNWLARYRRPSYHYLVWIAASKPL